MTAGRGRPDAEPAGIGLSAELLLQHSGRAGAELYRGGPRHAVERGDGWWLVLSGSREAAHNWVVVADPVAVRLIPELAAYVRLAGAPSMLAMTQAVMVAAGERLHRSALDLAVAAPHLGAPLDALDLTPPATDAVLAGAGDEEGLAAAGLAAAGGVLAAAFGFDGVALAEAVTPAVLFGNAIRVTTASVGGEVVAAVLLWTAEAVTHVCFAGTVPASQRRGYGRAVLVEALRRERAGGARVVHLVASADGERLYRRLGMREVGFGPLLLHAIPLGTTRG